MLPRRFKACFERIAPHQARRLPKAIPFLQSVASRRIAHAMTLFSPAV